MSCMSYLCLTAYYFFFIGTCIPCVLRDLGAHTLSECSLSWLPNLDGLNEANFMLIPSLSETLTWRVGDPSLRMSSDKFSSSCL
ncbi:unnamed protein product [Moneuplotes crassus]|uniref:Uncharacterized protein n=1 Tax=Euplotes crassus TaxID=5936 RepID=A0AAD2D6F7_EUPCR|nr:unnamed protein product [Moneuplotes crassus]